MTDTIFFAVFICDFLKVDNDGLESEVLTGVTEMVTAYWEVIYLHNRSSWIALLL
jgi:hypothetical protein